MRAIDADALQKEYKNQYGKRLLLIDVAPTIEPIIRCKDCIMHGVCRFEQGLGLDGYCSKAGRKSDDT